MSLWLRVVARRLPDPVKRFFLRLPRQIGYYWGPRVMSELRKRWVILRHPGATIRFEGPAHIGPGFKIHMPGRGTFIVGPNVTFRRNFLAEMKNDARIHIGEGSFIGYDVILACTTSIEVGRHCNIGPQVYVSDGKHDYGRDPHKPPPARGYRYQPTRLGDHSVVYGKSTVMASVGDWAMALGHSLVREPIPPYYIAAGLPARLVRYLGPPEGEPEEGRRQRLAWEAERVSAHAPPLSDDDAPTPAS